MSRAFLGLGGNLGPRRRLLRRALLLLDEYPGVRVLRASALYETAPWGVREQPPFLNAVVEVETRLAPRQLLAACKEIEARCGRTPTFRWGPRTVDLDILLYEGVACDEPDLTIPHPRLGERAFALVPLADLAPDLALPDGTPVHQRARALADQPVERVAGPEWACGLVAHEGALTDVPGLRVGQVSDARGLTGCTVVLCPPEGAVAGVDVRGAAPGTRETDLLRPGRLVERVHALVLAGGSAFGLDAARGVVEWLEERGVGFDAGVARVPIVPAAILFDLAVGDPRARPDAAMGREACARATAAPPEEGNAGAGTGATVGKLPGAWPMKGGVGTASVRLPGGAVVAALAAVNALGEVRDPWSGERLAGPRAGEGPELLRPEAWWEAAPDAFAPGGGRHTTLVVVATDARLDRAGACRLAEVAHDGLARAIFPCHTPFDGDVAFALATGAREVPFAALAAAAVEAVARAVVRAVLRAEGLPGLPSARDRLRAG